MSTLSRRSFVASLFVAPAIVKATSLMPVKAIQAITQDVIHYTIKGWDALGNAVTEYMDLPLTNGRFDPLLIEAKRHSFARVESIVWSEPPSIEKQIIDDRMRDFSSAFSWQNMMRHGRTNVPRDIHGRDDDAVCMSHGIEKFYTVATLKYDV